MDLRRDQPTTCKLELERKSYSQPSSRHLNIKTNPVCWAKLPLPEDLCLPLQDCFRSNSQVRTEQSTVELKMSSEHEETQRRPLPPRRCVTAYGRESAFLERIPSSDRGDRLRTSEKNHQQGTRRRRSWRYSWGVISIRRRSASMTDRELEGMPYCLLRMIE